MEGNEFKINPGYAKATGFSALPRVAANKALRDVVPVSGTAAKAGSALADSEALISKIGNQVDSLKSYIKSLGGIINQGVNETSPVRQAALQKEANQVFLAIKDKALTVSRAEPMSSDPVRSEVEQKIGRALEILFPEKETKKNVAEISFSNKELIISIQTRILKTTQYLDSLSNVSSPLPEELSDIAARAETAQVNAESAQSSVRDVDSAIQLAETAGNLIGAQPQTALSAIGEVRSTLNLRS